MLGLRQSASKLRPESLYDEFAELERMGLHKGDVVEVLLLANRRN
jgi:hypothetical protein